MEQVVWLAVGLVALIVLGLFIGGAGIVALVRKGRSWRTFFYVTFAVLSLGTVGVIGASRWHLLRELFKKDVDDPEGREKLQTASLEEGGEPAPPGEWPQWRGYHRNGRSPETGLLTDWPAKGPKEVWSKPLGGGYSSVSISGGRAYVTDRQDDQERALCFDAATGKELWEYRYDADYGGVAYGAGPRASPTVHDGRVYTVGATGVFLCLEAAPAGGKAKRLWRHDLIKEFNARTPQWGVACSPLVVGNLVIVQPGGTKGSIVAFDRKEGKLAWTALDDPSGYSSPVLTTAAGVRQVVCFTARRMVSLRPSDGALLWEYGWATPNNANIATPIVAGDYVFLSSDYQAGCALLELTPDGDGVKAKPVYVRRDKVMRNQFSTCVRHGDRLYGFDVEGYGGVGHLKCINLRTFEEEWEAKDLQKGCLLYADGHLLVLTERGELALVEATPKEYRRKAKVTVLGRRETWALPALAGRRLYLRDNEKLVCLDLKK